MTLGYHNHFWELPADPDGRPALLHLFEHLAPTVFAEVDIYWAQVGGVDPAELVAELGERAGLLHVKDGPADDRAEPDGRRRRRRDRHSRRARRGPTATWHIVELDRCDTDMFDAVERSYDYLVDNDLSRAGREHA